MSKPALERRITARNTPFIRHLLQANAAAARQLIGAVPSQRLPLHLAQDCGLPANHPVCVALRRAYPAAARTHRPCCAPARKLQRRVDTRRLLGRLPRLELPGVAHSQSANVA